MPALFVYGSLKEGFPNFHANAGRRLAGEYRTELAYPLLLYDGQLPCLLPLPGHGLAVKGQVFEVDDPALAAMDRLERVGEPGGYERHTIRVVRTDIADPAAIDAFVYMQDPALLAGPGNHVGPIDEYTPEQAQHLRW